MSSNESTSSSRLSQFGLYRTIDARTEEFLKLSRQRQIRQGCACAAVSTAVTVTVVVTVLFLYGYGVSSSSSATLRTPSWLDLMNDSTDTASFDDKFQNSIKFNRASMNLLPVFFDKILEDQESSSQNYEVPTEMNYKRSGFSISTNPFRVQAKIPTPGLYSIQYKTFPVLYIRSPRNTEYYMKVRKTREYERIMNYIDKMINEKVGLGTRSMKNLQYPTTEKYIDNSLTVPIVVRKTARVITKPKESKFTKIILQSNKNSKQLIMPNAKYNNAKMYENEKCKCRDHFGRLLGKILKCFQELVKDSSELPCNKKSPEKTAVENQNQKTKRPTSTTTLKPSMKPVLTTTFFTTTPSTNTKSTTTPTTTTIRTTNAQTDIFTSTEFPTEIFHFSNAVQQPALPIGTTIKPKKLLSQMSPLYLLTGNNNLKNNISKSNIFAPIKPKSNIFSTNNHKSKVIKIQNNNEQNFTFSITEKNVDKNIITTSTTTASPETSEEIFQNLLFPESKDREYTKLPQKALKKYSADYILRPRSREHLPPFIKPLTTTKPPTASTSYNLIKHQIDQHKKVSTQNIIDKMNSSRHAPILQTNNRPFSVITPEDYIMERIRHGSKKQNSNTIKSHEAVQLHGNKREESSNISVFDRIKNLLKTKLMQPRKKTPYNRLTAKIMNSKTEPKYVEDKQTNSPHNIHISTEYVPSNNFNILPTPYASRKIFDRITTSTTSVPSLIEKSTSPSQLKKYPQDPFLPEITTQPSIKELIYSPEITRQPSIKELIYSPEITTQPSIKKIIYSPEITRQPSIKELIYSPEITTQPSIKELIYSPEITTQPSIKELISSPEITTQPSIKELIYSPEITRQPSIKELIYSPEITTQSLIKELNYYRPLPKQGIKNIPYNSHEYIWTDDDVLKTATHDDSHADIKTTTAPPKKISLSTTTMERFIGVKRSSTSSAEIQAASADLGLNKVTTIHNNEKIASQTDDNYTPYKYMIPVGRKSYLEISRGDWKQKEPHADDSNALYDAFDDVDGL